MFSASHTDPPIVGASDIGHGFYWLTTSDRTRESNPGPTKYSCCKGRESNPGPTKISCARVSRKISRSRTKNTDRARDFHVERVHRMTDDGQTNGRRPDRPNFWIWVKRYPEFWGLGKKGSRTFGVLEKRDPRPFPRSKIRKSYQECVESYTTLSMSLNGNIPKTCRNLHSFLFHSRQACIIFNRNLSS
jgi:hypothetical protein